MNLTRPFLTLGTSSQHAQNASVSSNFTYLPPSPNAGAVETGVVYRCVGVCVHTPPALWQAPLGHLQQLGTARDLDRCPLLPA
jgi:hypothetical protein